MYLFFKNFYWFIISLIPISIGLLFFFDTYFSYFVNNIKDPYSVSLSFYYAIIGFFIAIVVFTVQHTTTKIDSEELERLPFSNSFSTITIILIFLSILFNSICKIYALEYPFTFISFILFIVNILAIPINLLMLFYLNNISRILKLAAKNTISWLVKRREFDIPVLGPPKKLKDHITKELNKKLEIYSRIAINSIKTNKPKVLRASYESVELIIKNYLEISTYLECLKDPVLDELNNKYSFAIEEALVARDEKFLEITAESIGVIIEHIIRNRKLIYGRQPFIPLWMEALQELCVKSFEKKRTNVCSRCINHMGQATYQLLENNALEAFDDANLKLHELAHFLCSKNSHWAASLLQGILVVFRRQFTNTIKFSFRDQRSLNTNDHESLLKNISETINKVKEIHTQTLSDGFIFAAFYGLDSFLYELASSNTFRAFHEDDVTRLLVILIDFNFDIIQNNPARNDYRVYTSISEVIYINHKCSNLSGADKKYLNRYLLGKIFNFLEKEIEISKKLNSSPQIIESIIDYFALFIFFNKKDYRLTVQFIKKYIKICKKIPSKNHDHRVIYHHIKLMVCWLSKYLSITNSHSTIITFLTESHEEPIKTFPHRIHLDFSESIFYPKKVWYLKPNYLWGNEFQNEIDRELNKGHQYYERFHNFIAGLAK